MDCPFSLKASESAQKHLKALFSFPAPSMFAGAMLFAAGDLER